MTHRRSSEGSQIQAFFQEPPYNGAMMVPRMPGCSPAPHRTLSVMRAPMTTAPLSVQSPWLPETDVVERHVCASPSQPPETACTAAAASTTAARALLTAFHGQAAAAGPVSPTSDSSSSQVPGLAPVATSGTAP